MFGKVRETPQKKPRLLSQKSRTAAPVFAHNLAVNYRNPTACLFVMEFCLITSLLAAAALL